MADKFYRGDTNILWINQGGTFQPVACLTGNSISERSEVLDTTTIANQGWTTAVPTIQSYLVNFDGYQVKDDGDVVSMLKLKTLKRTKVIFDWEIRTNLNEFVDFGRGFISDLSNVADVGDFVQFSGTIIGVGSLNIAQAGARTTWDRTDITFDQTDVTFDQT